MSYMSTTVATMAIPMSVPAPGLPPEIGELTSQVEVESQQGSGRFAREAASSRLEMFWDDARELATEMAWLRLPDNAVDELETQLGGATPVDMAFLERASNSSPSFEAVAAVRILGSIGEEGLVPMREARRVLLLRLTSPFPSVRNAVAEAFWQMSDRVVAPILRDAALVESHPEVRRTLEHVANVIG